MKTFEAKFKDNSDGVFAISLVNAPATMETFIALSKQEKVVKLSKVDEEQRILMGLVLQPNQLIYRKQDDTEFNIVFSEDTIKKLSHNFFKSGFQLNSKLEHETPIEGVSFVESWLVENSEIDKSANFGLSYPKGSWLATMKVDNDEIWDDYIKTGKLKGFSVDAMVDLQEVNLKSNIKMSEEKKNLLEKMEIWFTENILNQKEVKMGSVTSGDITIMFDGDKLEVGASLYIMVDDDRVPLPDGEYPTDSGMILVKDGRVEEIGKEQQEEEEEEVKEKPSRKKEVKKKVAEKVLPKNDAKILPKNDAKIPEPGEIKKKKKVQFEEVMKMLMTKQSEGFEAKLSELKSSYDVQLATVNAELLELKSVKAELVELKEQPASRPIVSTPIQAIELTRNGRLLEKLRK